MAPPLASPRPPALLCLLLAVWSPCGADNICTSAVCEYNFEITRGSTMTYSTPAATYNVVMEGRDLKIAPNSYRFAEDDPLIGSTVSADDVHTADGFSRNMFLVNGQFPGPAIEVLYGAQVIGEP